MGTMATQRKACRLCSATEAIVFHGMAEGERTMLHYTVRVLMWWNIWASPPRYLERLDLEESSVFQVPKPIYHQRHCTSESHFEFESIFILGMDKWFSPVFLPSLSVTEDWAVLPTMPQGQPQPSQGREGSYEASNAAVLLIHQRWMSDQ